MTAAVAQPLDAAAQADLLRKAVVSLERKLQERGAALAAVQAELGELRREQEHCASELRDAQAAASELSPLHQELAAAKGELRQARGEAGELRADRDRLQAGGALRVSRFRQHCETAVACGEWPCRGGAYFWAERVFCHTLCCAAGPGGAPGGHQRAPGWAAGAVEGGSSSSRGAPSPVPALISNLQCSASGGEWQSSLAPQHRPTGQPTPVWLQVGCARAQSESKVQAAAMHQLEAANEGLRLDVREQAAKLQAAYER